MEKFDWKALGMPTEIGKMMDDNQDEVCEELKLMILETMLIMWQRQEECCGAV